MELRNYNKSKNRMNTKISLSDNSQCNQIPITSNENTTGIAHYDKSDVTATDVQALRKTENIKETSTNCDRTTKVCSKKDMILEQISSPFKGFKHHETSICIEDVSHCAKEDENRLEKSCSYSSSYNSTSNNSIPLMMQTINENESLSLNESPKYLVSDKSPLDVVKTNELKFLAPKMRFKKRKLLSHLVKKLLVDSKGKN